MGLKDVQFITEPEDQKIAFDFVLSDIKYLNKMIERGDLDRNTQRIGAEQEVCIIDHGLRPAPIIMDFLEGIEDEHFTTELAKFVLEINLDPVELNGSCFSKLEEQIKSYFKQTRSRLNKMGKYDIFLSGILPTLKKMDMELDNLTPNERSKAMIEAMKWLKKKNYSIRINGIDEISTTDFSNMFESCNTSFQIHYQLNPDEFVKKFNYALAIAAPVLAACTNSPILFAKRLWHETRIALFQQAVDTRESTEHLAKADLRVPFGDEWLEEPLTQIFEKDLAKYKLFLKHKDPENTKKVWEQGKIPQLVNLQTFNSSIFHWTRPCYGVLDGKPHLRIENRLLPAGPTIIDQVANTAFWTGLMHGMPDTYADLPNRMAFEDAKINTLKAARYGLTSQFRWIEGKKIKAAKLIEKELLPIAEKGLAKAKVHHGDVEKYLQIIRDRVQSEQTGSQWMLDTWRELEMLETGEAKARVLTALIKKYQSDQKPVHQWPTKIDDLPKLDYSEVGHLMISDLYCVQEEDLIDQVIFSMSKKDHAHVPVTNKNGQLKGMLYADKILNKVVINGTSASRPTVVKEVMEKDPLTVSPGTSLTKAIKQMKQHHIKCLPVEHKDKLVGIITEYDIMQIAEKFLKNKN